MSEEALARYVTDSLDALRALPPETFAAAFPEQVRQIEARVLREVADEQTTHTTIHQDNRRTTTARPLLSREVRAHLHRLADERERGGQ